MPTMPFVKEAGAGHPVVCLHSNAAHSGQWRGLINALSPQYRLMAADSYGAGQTPDWPCDRTISLQDEVDLLNPVWDKAGDSFSLLGHSYGGAVALKAALQHPDRVRTLILFEPTFFAIVDQESPSPNDADGIRNAVNLAGLALDKGDAYLAAQHFIDFWMGTGSWEKTPDERKAPIAESVKNVRRWGHALFTEPTRIDAFHSLDIPVLYMTGGRSTLSAHGVAKRLIAALPNVESVEFPNMGHMGPITHADRVNQTIGDFLAKHV